MESNSGGLALYFLILISTLHCFPRKETKIRKWQQKDRKKRTLPKSRAKVEAYGIIIISRFSELVLYTMISFNLDFHL